MVRCVLEGSEVSDSSASPFLRDRPPELRILVYSPAHQQYTPAKTDRERERERKEGTVYEGVSKSFRTSRLERELQMVQLSATRCSCIAIL
jgi:hypothetical protein